MKLISWNVNGIRAVLKKDFAADVKRMNPDILCIQETKAHVDQVDALLEDYPYHYWNSAAKKGYSGTAIFSKVEPITVLYGLDCKKTDEEDTEGRVLILEFKDWFLVNTYTPNSGRGLKRADFRQEWDQFFTTFMKKLDKKKPVVLCGDLNVALTSIDLKNDKANYNKSAGYTQVEIDGLSKTLDAGFVDTWRIMHPDEVKYTWWSYMFSARANNVGWRIDYFIVSKRFMSTVKKSFILNDILGSDHCPVGIEL
jgi:exodeoxyribonuclease III